MNTKKYFYRSSITWALLPMLYALLPITSPAAVRVGNTARDYNQTSAARTATTTVDTSALPISVSDTDLATKIINGTATDVNLADLDACAAIYPTGEFAWDKPTIGTKRGTSAKCVSVVQMRIVKGTEDIIVATANLAAGDSVKCNISDFPTAGYTADAGTIVFPSDTAPTMDDVKRVMDTEQKKNAGLKIAAGIIVGGLAGNAAGSNDAGNDNILGNDKGKVKGAAIGALSGGAIMAGSSYAGKVGGDVILSTGVNAAAGAVVGNMAQVGDSVLQIEECEINNVKKSCLYGTLESYEQLTSNETAYYNKLDGAIIVCNALGESCKTERLIGIELDNADGKGYIDTATGMKDNEFVKIKKFYTYKKSPKGQEIFDYNDGNPWIKITAGGRPKERVNAMIAGFEDKKLGFKLDDWSEWKLKNQSATIIGRTNDGRESILPEKLDKTAWTVKDFYPLTIDADDGKLIDMGNKARLKGTAVGAAAGGGLGAFSAYQGAQDDISQRWVSAVQEYKDSLQKVYCATGKRFLSSYNDTAIIPAVQ